MSPSKQWFLISVVALILSTPAGVLAFSGSSELILSGRTSPQAIVTLKIPYFEISTPARADEGGLFEFKFKNLNAGVHSIYLVAVGNGHAREHRRTISLIENTSTTISDIDLTLPSDKPKRSTKKKSDLNRDGRIDLQDFSILLAKWATADPAGDIDGNGWVDLQDFSILLFYYEF